MPHGTETLAVPANHRSRLHDDEGAGAVRPQPMKGNPEEAVLGTKSGAFLSLQADGELLTQGRVFHGQGCPRHQRDPYESE